MASPMYCPPTPPTAGAKPTQNPDLFRDLDLHHMDVITDKGKEKETVPSTGHGNERTVAREENERGREEEAAAVVQRAWRHHSVRKKQLNSDARWKDTLVNAEKQVNYDAAQGNEKNDTKSRWKRGVFLAGRLEDGDAVVPADGQESTEQGPLHTKALETQHWLELVDVKHRYGSNLKWYHQKWAAADTPDNFFRWLDRGEGKDVSLPECSRDQLESERIIYLSAEQRLNYLVTIDSDGKLRWERNNQYVDTTPEMWIDAGEGRGIIRSDGSDEVHIRPRVPSATSGSSKDEQKMAKHYQGTTKDPNLNAFQRVWKDRFTTKGLMERLLRKTVRKNTWLYVSDKNYNILIGLKETGYFQHSSLTAGGLVTSAGLIEVKDGLVTSISPLSGHYRTSIEHFKQFLHAMEERGLDTHKVHMTKGEALLWGLEHWKGFQKSTKESKKYLKQAAHRVVHPNIAREEKQKSEEKAKEEDNARSKYEEAQHTKAKSTASSLKPEDVKDKALRERIEKMRKRKEQEDEQWKAGSQWRWEVITGRVQKSMKEKEQRWKSAMESVAPSASKSELDTVPGGQELLHPTKTADPAAAHATKEATPSTALTPADLGYSSDSATTQTSSHTHNREPGSEVPKVETVPEEGGPETPKDRPPSYDNYKGVNSSAEKSSSPT